MLASTGQLALAAADKTDTRARRVDASLTVRIPDLGEALRLKDDETFVLDIALRDEKLVGDLPTALTTRRLYLARKEAAA